MWNIGRGSKTATIRDTATGACVVCGKDAEGSRYWVGIGPVPTKFVTGMNLPLCGPHCSARHGGDDDWQDWLKSEGR